MHAYLLDASCNMVLCDIDDTLIQPTTWYGSTNWFLYEIRQQQEYGYTHKQALDYILPEYIRFQREEMVPQLMEADTATCIADIQAYSIPVFAVTSRYSGLAHTTLWQLSTLGIALSPTCGEHTEYLPDTFSVASGIVFTQGGDKGKALSYLLYQASPYTPSHVVYIDDTYHHLKEIESVCHQYNISFTGLWYSPS